VRRAWL
jgi:hypothetical protein